MKRNSWYIAGALIAALVLWAQCSAYRDCRRSGGHLIEGVGEYFCLHDGGPAR